MDDLITLIASSTPGYAVVVIALVALLAVAYFFVLPALEDRKRLVEENSKLQDDLSEALTLLGDIQSNLGTVTAAVNSRKDENLAQAFANLRLFIEQTQNQNTMSIETISRAIDDLEDTHEKLKDTLARRDNEYSMILQRYDGDLRAMNDKLSQLVGAQWGASAAGKKRGIN